MSHRLSTRNFANNSAGFDEMSALELPGDEYQEDMRVREITNCSITIADLVFRMDHSDCSFRLQDPQLQSSVGELFSDF